MDTVGISLVFYNRSGRGLFRCHAQTGGINWRLLRRSQATMVSDADHWGMHEDYTGTRRGL